MSDRSNAVDAQGDDDDRVTMGSTNVFQDFGLPDAEARQARILLAATVMDIVQDNGWSQKEAAERFRTDPANISKILGGRVRGFSIDRLLQLLANAGYSIDMMIGAAPSDGGTGSIDVSQVDRKLRLPTRSNRVLIGASGSPSPEPVPGDKPLPITH